MMRVSISQLVALIAWPMAELAQTPAPNGRLLGLGSDTLVVYAIQGSDTTETGLIIDSLFVRGEGERSLLWRIYRSSDAILGNRVDTLVDAFHDLTPGPSSQSLSRYSGASGIRAWASEWHRLPT